MLRGLRTRGAPLWAAAIQAADRWHLPPWEIWAAPDAALWLDRATVYDEEARAARGDAPTPSAGGAAHADAFAAASDGIPYHQMSED